VCGNVFGQSLDTGNWLIWLRFSLKRREISVFFYFADEVFIIFDEDSTIVGPAVRDSTFLLNLSRNIQEIVSVFREVLIYKYIGASKGGTF
jgi:hypothetical protein